MYCTMECIEIFVNDLSSNCDKNTDYIKKYFNGYIEKLYLRCSNTNYLLRYFISFECHQKEQKGIFQKKHTYNFHNSSDVLASRGDYKILTEVLFLISKLVMYDILTN